MDNYISKKKARIVAKKIVLDFKKNTQNISLKEKVLQESLFKKYEFSENSIIALYKNDKYEVETRYLFRLLLEQNATIALPIIDHHNHRLKFYRLFTLEAYDNFKISTALTNKKQDVYISISNITHFVIPSLGISKQKYRLGRGSGFYDATLNEAHNCVFLTMLFTKKQVLQFQHSPYDIKMNEVLYLENIIQNL